MPKIYVNNNYFSSQNERMAYILGFLAADGNVSKQGNRIQSQLSIKDKDQLIMIQSEIGGCEVYEYRSNEHLSCGWQCFSAQIKKDLADYNSRDSEIFNDCFINVNDYKKFFLSLLMNIHSQYSLQKILKFYPYAYQEAHLLYN